jgi:Uma2 family endonuclease
MQAETNQKLYTYDDYLKLDDDNRYELIGGELILVPAPKTVHQRVSQRLNHLLTEFVLKNNLGEVLYSPVDVVLTKTDKPQPDILFISKERLNIIKEEYIDGAPDLVIEILSASTAKHDRVLKSRLYFAHGVKEYWIIDPDLKTVEIFIPGENNWYLFGAYHEEEKLISPLLSGLEINLKDVFAGLTP